MTFRADPVRPTRVRGSRARTGALLSTARAPLTVLNNSFDITAGDTVVVGTSRLQGDTALVVLLTAVPANK